MSDVLLEIIMTVVAIMMTSLNSGIGHSDGYDNNHTYSASSNADHSPSNLEWCLNRCRIYCHSDHRAYAANQR
jgi:hypothetical protein